MNLIEAIKKAKEKRVSVIAGSAWSYTSDGVGRSNIACAPGLVSPDFLLGIIGQIAEHCLLRDDWGVESKKERLSFLGIGARPGGQHIAEAIANLAMVCSRECGSSPLKEVWIEERAYDALSLEATRFDRSDEDQKKTRYLNGLVEVYFPCGKVRVRRAS